MHRILVLWLLIFTLPVQGWAALAHANCASAPQPIDAFANAQSQHPPEAGSADHHHRAALLADQGTSPQDSPLPDPSCSGACHACCLAPSMMPPQAQSVAAPAAGLLLTVWRAMSLPDAPTARLERPPRLALAA